MFNAGVFNYVDILHKAADASWARNEVISNNLANVSTPGYKRQDVNFENFLQKELKNSGSLDFRVANVNLEHINYSTYTDMKNYSYRIDGNNVDEAMENAELSSNQMKYQALTIAMSSEFSRLKTAMS